MHLHRFALALGSETEFGIWSRMSDALVVSSEGNQYAHLWWLPMVSSMLFCWLLSMLLWVTLITSLWLL
jgi:hypothetical protein